MIVKGLLNREEADKVLTAARTLHQDREAAVESSEYHALFWTTVDVNEDVMEYLNNSGYFDKEDKISKREIVSVEKVILFDECPDTSYLEQEGFEDRLEQFNDGQFNFFGTYIKVTVNIDGTLQTLTSGGLWCIESDSNPEYLDEIHFDEMAQLNETLKALGIREIKPSELDLEERREK